MNNPFVFKGFPRNVVACFQGSRLQLSSVQGPLQFWGIARPETPLMVVISECTQASSLMNSSLGVNGVNVPQEAGKGWKMNRYEHNHIWIMYEHMSSHIWNYTWTMRLETEAYVDRASFPGFLDESEFKCRPDDFATQKMNEWNECAKLSIIRLVISIFFALFILCFSTCAMMYDVGFIGFMM